MNCIWNPTFDDIFEAMKRAKTNGKKAGDSYEEEFIEVMQEKGQKPIANTELTKEEMIKEYTSHGKNILDVSVDKEGKSNYKIYKKVDNEE